MRKGISTSLKIILVFTLFPILILAQKDYHDGFVVLQNNDTLFGKVKDRKSGAFGGLYEKIRFKGQKGKSKYRPDEIMAYVRGNEKYESLWISTSGSLFNVNYNSSRGLGEMKFLKVMAKGKLTYYHLEFEDSDSGFIDAIPLFKKIGNTSMERITQGIFGLRKKRLAAYLHDCPELGAKILNEVVKDPFEIIELYNNCARLNKN